MAYVTTWPGDDPAGLRYDPHALGFFENLRRHPYLRVWATQYSAATVGDEFQLAGAARALDALNCPPSLMAGPASLGASLLLVFCSPPQRSPHFTMCTE